MSQKRAPRDWAIREATVGGGDGLCRAALDSLAVEAEAEALPATLHAPAALPAPITSCTCSLERLRVSGSATPRTLVSPISLSASSANL